MTPAETTMIAPGDGAPATTGRLAALAVSKSYGALCALDDATFMVQAGEVHGLVGANGAGKSTLVALLSAATAADRGRIEIDGAPCERYTPIVAHAAGLRTIHQERRLCSPMSVAENVCLGTVPLRHGLIDRGAMEREAAATLARLGSDLDPGAQVESVSRADQQVVEIARALHDSGRFLLMDEPTAALSHSESRLLLAIVEGLRDEGCGIVYVSHNLNEVIEACDLVTVLRDGRVVATASRGELSVGDLSALVAGGATVVRKRRHRAEPTARPGVASFKGVSAGQCRDVTFDLHRGEILALVGLLGAGHLDAGLALFGAVQLKAGAIRLNGEPVRLRRPADACARGIGLVPPDRKSQGLLFDLSIAENAALPNVALRPPRVLTRFWTRRIAERWFPSLAVKAADIDDPIGSLSGGNQQKVVFAKWLAADVQLLILAEPTSGIDVGAKEELCQLAERFVADGHSILLVSSDVDEVARLAGRALVFQKGAVVTELASDDITANALLEATG